MIVSSRPRRPAISVKCSIRWSRAALCRRSAAVIVPPPRAGSAQRTTQGRPGGEQQRVGHPLGADIAVAQRELHGEPVHQRRQHQRHAVGLHRRRKLTSALGRGDRLAQHRPPAAVKQLPGARGVRLAQRPRPDLQPHLPHRCGLPSVVVAGGTLQEADEPRHRSRFLLQRRLDTLVEAILDQRHDRVEDLVLGREVVEHRRRAAPGSLGDVGEPGVLESALADHVQRRPHDLLAADVGDLGTRAHAGVRRDC